MNIYDIARLADVSIATVSRVVNDSPKVSDRTKAHVRKVMEEHHYTPNVFARGLGLNSMKTVGIICPDVADSYMAKAVSYLEKNLQGYGYDCILYCSGYEAEDKQKAVDLILKKKIDALILVGSNYVDGTLDFFPEENEQIPVFLINGYLEDERICCVLADDYQAVYDAADALLFEGRRRILFLANSGSYSAKRKQSGYEAALADHHIEVDPGLILFSGNSIYATRDLLLRKRDLDFDSVIAVQDVLAVGALKYAQARGLAVPEEIAIIGYDNSELSVCCEPELSSVDNRVEALCKTAIDSLMALLAGETVKQKQMIKCHLIKRCTTDF